MGKRIFSYRSAGMWVLIIFLLIWGLGFGISPLLTDNAHFTVNKQPATESQSETMRVAFCFLGFLAVVGSVCAFLKWLNDRIEIEGEAIRWIDWKGKLRVEVTSDQVSKLTPSSGLSRFVVTTSKGEIRFSKSINDFGILKSMLEQASQGFTGWQQRIVSRNPVTYSPMTVVGNYRFGSMFAFSVVWLLFTGFMLVMMVFMSSTGVPWPAIGFLLLLMTPGIYMQLMSWNESIILSPVGIRWIDWRRRERVNVGLNDIVSFDTQVVHSENSTSEQLKIYTDQGTISAMSYLKNYQVLKVEIGKILQSREAKSPPQTDATAKEEMVSPFTLPGIETGYLSNLE